MTDAEATDAEATVADVLDAARRRLHAAGITDSGREARLLLGHATGLDAAAIIGHPERRIAPEALKIMTEAVSDRARRRPMAQVTGKRAFWTLELRVTPATLDPRPDSETVIEAVLDQIEDRDAPLTVLDLGTGSGCLLLALLDALPNATGIGTDSSAPAIEAAAANARDSGIAPRARFAVTDWDAAIRGRFDIVVSNPPYIPTGEIDRLAPEGLDAYRALAPVIGARLVPGGICVLEIGAGQKSAVTDIMVAAGLRLHQARADLAGVSRCLVLRPNRPVKRELTGGP
jgi:release factor glutamine methyltransferase